MKQTNKQAKKASLKDLLNRAAQSKKDKLKIKNIYIESLGGELTLRGVEDGILYSAINGIGDGKDFEKIMQTYDELIYHSCDILHDKELIKECEVAEPTEVPRVLFSISERSLLGEEILKLSGFNEVGENIKN